MFILYVAHTNAASNVPKTPHTVCLSYMMRLLTKCFYDCRPMFYIF